MTPPSPPSPTRSSTTIHPWRVLLLFAVLSLALTWPLLPHILTHVPGDGIDDPALAWNLWWAKHSWVDQAGQDGLVHNVFDGDSMFHPVGVNLAFYTLTLLNGALSIPLQSAFSVILASNLLLLSSFVLSGFGAYLLALTLLSGSKFQVSGSSSGRLQPSTSNVRYASVIAGLLYAFASTKLFYASLGQFNIASSQWLPFIALYLVRSLRPPFHWRNGILLGLFLCFQTWAELTYGAFAVLLIVLVVIAVGGWRIAVRLLAHPRVPLSPRPSLPPSLISILLAAVIFLLGLAPYLANMLPDLAAEGDFLVEGRGFADLYSADLAGFFLPTQLHPLLGGLVRNLSGDSALRPDGSQWQVNKGQHLFLGFSVMALAAYGLWGNRRKAWVWLVAGMTGFFLWLVSAPACASSATTPASPASSPFFSKFPSSRPIATPVVTAFSSSSASASFSPSASPASSPPASSPPRLLASSPPSSSPPSSSSSTSPCPCLSPTSAYPRPTPPLSPIPVPAPYSTCQSVGATASTSSASRM